MKIPTVALVGRPNVGKSTIFNKLVGKKISIIEDTPGVTRDRIYSDVVFKNYKFHLIDTGGIDVSKELFNKEIIVQAEIAINEADVIVFIIDGKEELNQNDFVIRDMLIKSGKKIIVAVNKMDNPKNMDNIYSYYELGFDNIIPVSGEHNIGLISLEEEIVKDFVEVSEDNLIDDKIRFCVIGRPNVGKSSLVNALLNEEKAIVSDIAGTTRDAVDTPFRYDNKDYVIIDTAGIRKSGKIYENIEKYSVASYALEAGKPLVIVVNKWDTVDDQNNIREFTKLIRAEFKFLSYVPIVFVSAKTKKRIHTIMPEVCKVYNNSIKEIKTSILNDVIRDAVMLNQPPSYKGKRLKIYFVSQTGIAPPKFTFNVNSKGLVHFSYKRYLENKIRESFDFEGTPIEIIFKNKNGE